MSQILSKYDYIEGGINDHDSRWILHRNCTICSNPLTPILAESSTDIYYKEDFRWLMGVCFNCGWWWTSILPEHSYSRAYWKSGVLFKLDNAPTLLENGIFEITKNTSKLFQMNPTKFEQFVGGILSEHLDCQVVHTGKSNDGGIDLMLMDSEKGIIPIQVKRREKPNSKETVSLIREFRGAFLYRDYKQGMIVTTAGDFTKQAKHEATPKDIATNFQGIELINCKKLLEIMNLLTSSENYGLLNKANRLIKGGLRPKFDMEEKIKIFQENPNSMSEVVGFWDSFVKNW